MRYLYDDMLCYERDVKLMNYKIHVIIDVINAGSKSLSFSFSDTKLLHG